MISQVETNINTRWENGTPHHPKSENIYKNIAELDFILGGDYFCFEAHNPIGMNEEQIESLQELIDSIPIQAECLLIWSSS